MHARWVSKCKGLNCLHIFQSHVLVSVVGDAFRASKKQESNRGGRDLIVEALRHKVSFAFTIRDRSPLFLLFSHGAEFSLVS